MCIKIKRLPLRSGDRFSFPAISIMARDLSYKPNHSLVLSCDHYSISTQKNLTSLFKHKQICYDLAILYLAENPYLIETDCIG